MKICVLGAGVIGVSTAYMLARLGHEVNIIDQGKDVATGASHANGAQLSYSYVDPFASPTTLRKLPGYILGADPAIRLGLSVKRAYLRWGLNFLAQCRTAQFSDNLKFRTELANLSYKTMALIDDEIGTKSMARTAHGKIVLASSMPDFKRMQIAAQQRSDQDCLDAKKCLAVEPSLASWRTPIYGGLYAQNDSALDPLIYCKALQAKMIERFGVKFHLGRTIKNIRINGTNALSVETDYENYDCEAAIICLGNDPAGLLESLGIKTPIYPMQGYSLTLKTTKMSPTTSITDVKNKMVFASLGDKIRIAGFMDANQKPERAKARGEQLLKTARLAWPDIADYQGPVEHWTHFRPMVPSGVPVIGATKYPGLFLNVGHGSLGYTFAAGSAMKIATEIGHAYKNTEPTTKENNYANHS